MKLTYSTLFLTVAVFVGAIRLAAAESNDGGNWESLFDGTSLKGWQIVNDASALVTNGVLRVGGGMGWLRTEKTFTNFILEAEWRGLEANYNSGFFVRAGTEGKPFPVGGWQVNLKASAVGALLKGSMVIQNPKLPTLPVGQWCKFRIEARGRTLTLFVNGEKVWQFDELGATQGSIGLQAEGKTMEFRNVRLRHLPSSAQGAR